MSDDLKAMDCVPCRGGEPTVTDEEIEAYKPQVPEWEIVTRDGVRRLERRYDFEDFEEALAFANEVGEAAEDEGHHPKLVTEWGQTTVTWWTHAIDGLHRNDFIMAAKTDDIYEAIFA